MNSLRGQTNPPSPEVEAAYVEFLCLLEEKRAPSVQDFVKAHAECDPEELLLYLEAIVEVGHIGSMSGAIAAGDDERPELPDSRYRIEGIIGRGGMGLVFLVQDVDMNRQVAMKVVRRFATSEAARLQQLFLEEALTAARLEHPNIVPVYDRGITSDGRAYYTMRWVQGRTFAEVIGALARMEEETLAAFGRIRLLQIFYQLALGVGYAHGRGIAHLDLKPANVMIGAFGEVLTLDWGLARPIGSRSSEREDAIVGTPGYMAPEQIQNLPVDPRSDVFALGAILYECLTLQRCIAGETQTDTLALTLNGEYGEVDPRLHLPEELLAILKRAMAVSPGERFASAVELAEEVFHVIEGAQERARKHEQANREVDVGREQVRRYRHLRDHVLELRKGLAQREANVMPHWPLERKEGLWRYKLRLEALERGVASRFASAVATFQGALAMDPAHSFARRYLATLHWEEFLATETNNDFRVAAMHLGQVGKYDDGSLRNAIEGHGRLWLRLRAPRDASVALRELKEKGPLLVPGAVIVASRGSMTLEENLPMGRYIVEVTAANRTRFSYAVRIRRMGVVSPFLLYDERCDDPKLAMIPGGEYELGGDPDVPESPARTVRLDDFMIGRDPVTCAEYLEFLDAMRQSPMSASLRVPRSAAGRPLWAQEGRVWKLPERSVVPYLFLADGPVVGVSWLDAQAYCEWRTATDTLGRTFSLPTSDEWEAAARGADGRLFPWGDRYDPSLANNRDSHKGLSRIMSVGVFTHDISPLGVRGTAGNASDWCQDYGSQGNRQMRIVRGGSWNSSRDEAHLACASMRRPDDTSPDVSFRIRATMVPAKR